MILIQIISNLLLSRGIVPNVLLRLIDLVLMLAGTAHNTARMTIIIITIFDDDDGSSAKRASIAVLPQSLLLPPKLRLSPVLCEAGGHATGVGRWDGDRTVMMMMVMIDTRMHIHTHRDE